MTYENSIRKSFALPALVALTACSSAAVETMPTATTVPAAAPSSVARYGLCGGAAAIALILLVITRRRPATRRE